MEFRIVVIRGKESECPACACGGDVLTIFLQLLCYIHSRSIQHFHSPCPLLLVLVSVCGVCVTLRDMTDWRAHHFVKCRKCVPRELNRCCSLLILGFAATWSKRSHVTNCKILNTKNKKFWKTYFMMHLEGLLYDICCTWLSSLKATMIFLYTYIWCSLVGFWLNGVGIWRK